MGITVNTSNQQITASVGETKIDVSVGGGVGPTGSIGAAGTAATVAVGTVTTGAAGSQASVSNVGTSSAAVLDFTIPTGATGPQGPAGPAGASAWDGITGKPIFASIATSGSASDLGSGTVPIARIPTGTSSTTVALGDHTHAQLHDRSHAITSTSDHTAGNWKVLYTNGSGQVVELALGSSGQALLSNGASAAPSWGSAGSTNASDLTSGTLAYARMADPTVTSPSQITGNQNDYAAFARGVNRFTTNGAYNLTGMAAGNDGEVRILTNVGTTTANTLTIKDESTSSTAANRFSVPWNSDCVIQAEGSVVVFYDNTSTRWRVL